MLLTLGYIFGIIPDLQFLCKLNRNSYRWSGRHDKMLHIYLINHNCLIASSVLRNVITCLGRLTSGTEMTVVCYLCKNIFNRKTEQTIYTHAKKKKATLSLV